MNCIKNYICQPNREEGKIKNSAYIFVAKKSSNG